MKLKIMIFFFILCLCNNIFAQENVKVLRGKSENERFSVQIFFNSTEITSGPNTAKMVIYDANNLPVEDAKIDIVLWMNEHGHFSSATPKTINTGKGEYRIKELDFEMSGKWELRILIKKDKVSDRISFDIDVK